MSLWAKSQQLKGEALQQVHSLYGDHFPIEVRHCLADWIERNILFDFDLDEENAEPQQYAAATLDSLIYELNSQAELLSRSLLPTNKQKLQSAAKMFRIQYVNNPLSLLMIIRHCLVTELKLVKQTESSSPDDSANTLQQLQHLKKQSDQTSQHLSKIQDEQEAFQTQSNTSLQNQTSSSQQDQSETTSQQNRNIKREKLLQMWLVLIQKQQETLLRIESLQVRILDDELGNWKREQQLAGNGFRIQSNIFSIQVWCEGLAEIILLTRNQIQEAELLQTKFPIEESYNFADHFSQMKLKLKQLLTSLVKRSFIIEDQAPQVIEKHVSFMATIRLLIGNKLDLLAVPPRVTVSVISEEQANTLLKDDRFNDQVSVEDASGKMFYNTSSMVYQKISRQLSATFRKMIIWDVVHADNKDPETELHDKFVLLFQSEFPLGDEESMIKVSTLSLPFVFVVSDLEKCHAWASVTWHNAFAEPGRMPFVVPDQVPWDRVAETLSTKFRSATGRALSELNKQHIASMVLDDPNSHLTWSQFYKEPLPGRTFTLWDWFFALMKLVKEHLRSFWIESKIFGFIAPQEVADLLQPCLPGTFMILFSDSALGAIEIAWVGDNSEISMLPPVTFKDLAIRTLADRVSNFEDLTYLYPDVPKSEVFGEVDTLGTKWKSRASPSHDPSPGASSETNRTPQLSKIERKKAKNKLAKKAYHARKKEEKKAKNVKKEKKDVDVDPYPQESDDPTFQPNISRPLQNLNV